MMVNAQQVYKRHQYETSSPAELTMQLYNGAIRFLEQAQEAHSQGKLDTVNDRLVRAQDIISELAITLDTTVEIGQQLARLYDYMLYRLRKSNVKKDVAIMKEVSDLLTELRDSWKEVVKYSRQQAASGEGL